MISDKEEKKKHSQIGYSFCSVSLRFSEGLGSTFGKNMLGIWVVWIPHLPKPLGFESKR